MPREFLLRSDNGLVFTSRRYTSLVRSYGLKQEFITPHCPQQNGMVGIHPVKAAAKSGLTVAFDGDHLK